MKQTPVIIMAALSLAVVAVAFVAFDNRSPVEKAGSAIRETGREIKDAVDPRTPTEKIKDGIQDTMRGVND